MRNGFFALVTIFGFLLTSCSPSVYEPLEAPQKQVITILFGQSNSDPGLEDMLTDKIYDEFPDVSLEWESVDWGDYFSSEMQAKLASGEVPDMIIGKAQDAAAYQSSGYLAEFDNSFYKNIKPEVLDSVTINGKVYGIPYNIFNQGVIYNKNIFWRYGLTPPDTLEEMDTLVGRLQEVGVTPFATHFRENWFIGNVTMQFAVNQVFLRNSKWGDEFRAGRQSFEASQDYAACFQQVQFLFENTWPDVMTVNQYECGKRFANQEAAMYLTGTWALQAVSTIRPNLELGIFPYPNADGTARLLFEPNLTFMKNARSANGEVVDNIIKSIINDKELLKTVCAFTHTTPAVKETETEGLNKLETDISFYTDSGRTIDVTIGNRQLIWRFQDACARQIYDWLENKITFEDVLKYADDNRAESGEY